VSEADSQTSLEWEALHMLYVCMSQTHAQLWCNEAFTCMVKSIS